MVFAVAYTSNHSDSRAKPTRSPQSQVDVTLMWPVLTPAEVWSNTASNRSARFASAANASVGALGGMRSFAAACTNGR